MRRITSRSSKIAIIKEWRLIKADLESYSTTKHQCIVSKIITVTVIGKPSKILTQRSIWSLLKAYQHKISFYNTVTAKSILIRIQKLLTVTIKSKPIHISRNGERSTEYYNLHHFFSFVLSSHFFYLFLLL